MIKLKQEELKDSREYGFGFWFRYLARYPSVMLKGKNEPWYHLARLTSNEPYRDLQLGDRMLAVFQGADAYHFFTQDDVTKNVNINGKIEFLPDLEGVWTYLYFSFSRKNQKAVAMLQYGTSVVRRIELNAAHIAPK